MTGVQRYAGVGSRETPMSLQPVIAQIGTLLAKRGYVLHSGAAPGFDTMIERAHVDAGGRGPEIYLPWRGFGHHRSTLYTIPERAFELAALVHPTWDRLTDGVRKLHARNVQQVLGRDLSSPVEFVVCWTPGGRVVGGTATAIKIAALNQIRVDNLFDAHVREQWLAQKEP